MGHSIENSAIMDDQGKPRYKDQIRQVSASTIERQQVPNDNVGSNIGNPVKNAPADSEPATNTNNPGEVAAILVDAQAVPLEEQPPPSLPTCGSWSQQTVVRRNVLVGLGSILVGIIGFVIYYFTTKSSSPKRDCMSYSAATTTRIENENNETPIESSTIPTCLGLLTRLTHLDLHSQNLAGTIPTELGALTGLTWLVLENNAFTGTIPVILGSMSVLARLDLEDNALNGTIPVELSALTWLEYLDISGNDISSTIPTELAEMTSLTELYLDNNQLVGSIPEELAALTALGALRLQKNQLTGTIPSWVANVSNVNLDNNNFTLNSTIATTAPIPTSNVSTTAAPTPPPVFVDVSDKLDLLFGQGNSSS